MIVAAAALAGPCGTGDVEVLGKVESDKLDEISGIVASRRHPGVFWVHNDSGDKARVFAVGSDGKDLGNTDLERIEARDWEDLALIPGKTHDWLVVGDTGDNRQQRSSVFLHRFSEPAPGTPSVVAETLTVTYPQGRAHNVEALLVNPRDGELFLVSKVKEGQSTLYSLGPFAPGARVAKAVATLPKLEGIAYLTGGDVRADGAQVALRSYTHVHFFDTSKGIAAGLAQQPCAVPWVEERQGESVAYVDGAVVTVSEGENPPLNRVPLTP